MDLAEQYAKICYWLVGIVGWMLLIRACWLFSRACQIYINTNA